MIPMLQKLPVSVLSIFTFKEVITYALALERGGDEALQQVIAKVEVALFATNSFVIDSLIKSVGESSFSSLSFTKKRVQELFDSGSVFWILTKGVKRQPVRSQPRSN